MQEDNLLFENEVFTVTHDEENVYVTNKQTGITELTTKRLLTALFTAEQDCIELLEQSYNIEREANFVSVH